MPLNAANFVLNGRAASADLMQFVNLLTGVMTDQPVTITNTLTATTHLGNGTVPAAGANGQVLTKSAAASYSLTWTTPFSQANADALYQTPAQAAALYLPLTGGTLTGPLMFNPDNTRDIGAAAATRPRTVYAATSFIGPGAVPTGGTANQVLQKNTATAYDVGWVTLPVGFTQVQADARYLQLVGGTLAGPGNLSIGGSLTFPNATARILGDMSSSPTVNRLTFMTSTVNGATTVAAVPNGTGTTSAINLSNAQNPDQASLMQFIMGGTFANIVATHSGTAPDPDLLFTVSSLERMRIRASDGAIILSPPANVAWPNGAYITPYTNGSDVRLVISGLTVTPNPTATGVLAVNGTMTVAGASTFNGNANFANGMILTGGTFNVNNTTIQFVQTMYGLNNGCYLTNDGATWSSSSNFSAGGTLTCGSTLTVGGGTLNFNGIYLYLNATNVNPYGIINTGGGDLYIRAATGTVHIDSGNLIMAAAIVGITSMQVSSYMWCPTIYFNTSTAAPYIQQVSGISIRYMHGSGGVHSFESAAGGLGTIQCTILNFNNNITCNGAAWRSDGVQCIMTLPPTGSQHWFMTNGQATWAMVYAAGFANQSARKSKTDIRILDDALGFVLNDTLHGVRYRDRATGDARVGFIADDWHVVLPEVVGLDDVGDVAMLEYGQLSAVTFEALKQHVLKTDARLNALEARLAA